MKRIMLKSKIHRATVTQADVNYEGSITIDTALLEAADIRPYEFLDIWNITNGNRFSTYALEGPRDSGTICVNGAAAHMVNVGDLVIIASKTELSDAEIADFKPLLVFVDEDNKIKNFRKVELPGPLSFN